MQADNHFASFNFVEHLQAEEWRTLQAGAHTQSISKNAYVFRANDINAAVYVLLEGRIKIKRLSAHGRELIQWFCLPGELFGLAEDNIKHQRGLYAQALTDTKLLCIPKEQFQQYLVQHSHIALFVIEQLASRLRAVGDILLNMSSEDAHSRLICLLNRLVEFCGIKCERGIYVDMYLSHQEMADMIGVCRQTVSSMISQLKQDGVIDTDRHGIYIKSASVTQGFDCQTVVTKPISGIV